MCVFDPFSLNRAICVSIGLQLYIVTLSHHQWVYNWKQPFPLSLSLSVKKNSSPVRDRVHKSLLHLCLTIGRTILWWPRAGIKRYSKFMIVITVSCPEDDNLQLFSHIIYLLLLSDSILRIWTFLLYKCSATTQKGKKKAKKQQQQQNPLYLLHCSSTMKRKQPYLEMSQMWIIFSLIACLCVEQSFLGNCAKPNDVQIIKARSTYWYTDCFYWSKCQI